MSLPGDWSCSQRSSQEGGDAGAPGTVAFHGCSVGRVRHVRDTRADSRTRTDDLLITSQLLYQLSYAGKGC